MRRAARGSTAPTADVGGRGCVGISLLTLCYFGAYGLLGDQRLYSYILILISIRILARIPMLLPLVIAFSKFSPSSVVGSMGTSTSKAAGLPDPRPLIQPGYTHKYQ